MGLSRRGFLGALGSGVAAVYAVNAELFAVAQPTQAFPPKPQQAGCRYRGIRAHKDLSQHDIVCVEDGVPLGVATADIRQGEYGWMQTYGPATIRWVN